MIVSSSIHVASNGIISFLWLSSIPLCVRVCVRVCVCAHLRAYSVVHWEFYYDNYMRVKFVAWSIHADLGYIFL